MTLLENWERCRPGGEVLRQHPRHDLPSWRLLVQSVSPPGRQRSQFSNSVISSQPFSSNFSDRTRFRITMAMTTAELLFILFAGVLCMANVAIGLWVKRGCLIQLAMAGALLIFIWASPGTPYGAASLSAWGLLLMIPGGLLGLFCGHQAKK